MEIEHVERRKVVRASGIKRRKLILEAALRVILREGVRGIRHRAIAEEAQVPLASTTYYFKDIEELISETFLFWNHRASVSSERLCEQMRLHLENFSAGLPPDRHSKLIVLQNDVTRQQYVEHLSELASTYLTHHINNNRDDRLIELAFHHEAVRSEMLQQVVRHRMDLYRQTLESFFRVLGSEDVEADAQVALSVLLRLEQEAIVEGCDVDGQKIQQIISRHINNTLMAISQDWSPNREQQPLCSEEL